MSDYTIETINLTPTARLRVEHDQDTSNPRKDWDMLTGFMKIGGRGDSRLIDVEPVHETPIPIRDAQERIEREEDVVRWARIFHGLHIEYDSEHGGYWFVDPTSWAAGYPKSPEIFTLERQAEIIEGERETYQQWADGEVYIVIFERLVTQVTYQAGRTEQGFEIDTTQPPVVVDLWDEVESIGSNYLDDDYTAQAVADEYFELTPEEFVALGLPGSPLSELPLSVIDDIRAAEEDVVLINEQTGRLTAAGELYLRDLRRHESVPREPLPGLATDVSGEW